MPWGRAKEKGVGSNAHKVQNALMAGAAIAVVAVVIAVVIMQMAAPAARPGEITVYCDHSLRPVVDDIVEAFQRRSDVRVTVYSGTNEEILREFENDPQGADIFMPSDDYYLEQAGELIAESTPLAWTAPVILVEGGNPHGIETVADLAKPGLSLGFAEPDGTSLGRATATILARHGLSMDDIAPNIAFTSGMDAQLGNAVRLGQVDAAIVWEPTAHHVIRCDIVPIPLDEDVMATVAAAISTHSTVAESARTFLDFLSGRAATAVFERYHHATAPPGPGAESPTDDNEDGELTEVVFGR